MKRADPLLEQVSRMLGRYLPGDARHIVVALSGGADSVCLLHALLSLKPLHGCTLSAVHLNHLLRGQAAFEDAAFVEALCQRLGVELLSEQADVAALSRQRHIGEELAGRQARYDLFEKAAARYDGAVVATAHTASDQAETLLLHLLRGSGLDGLAGIPPQRPGYLRPLLLCTRRQVEDYCARNNLFYVTDASNLQPVYRRNRIRLSLLPELERDYNPNLTKTLSRTALLLREELQLLNEWADSLPATLLQEEGLLVFDRAALRQAPPALARRHLRRQAASSFGVTLSAAQSQELLELALRGQNGSFEQLPPPLLAQAQGGRLFLFLRPEPARLCPMPLREGCNDIPGFGKLWISYVLEEKFHKDATTHLLRCDIIPHALSLRARQSGDRYRPVGRKQALLSDLMGNAHIPRALRDVLPVISAGEEIVSCFPFGPAASAAAPGCPALMLRYAAQPSLGRLVLPQPLP